nr:zinc finger BED domain-containing protein RICESLEEPER 2 [Tanacetum cinerariifolium]
MHKRIINFRPINSHKGDDMGRKLLECIHEWGIKHVMTISVNDASTNDKALDFLIERLPNIYDSGKHFQIRCFAHVLNLIVKKGLTELDDSVQRVTKTVRYIKNSTQRISKFKKCIEDSEITTKRFLVSDYATRWNSTFDTLKVANELKDAFYKYDIRNSEYRSDLVKVPEAFDFRTCAGFVEFLEKFKVKPESMSASTKPLTHLFFGEILDIDTHLRKWQAKHAFKVMASKMRSKFKKYWENLSKINNFMYFDVLLDPTIKSQLIAHGFRKIIRYDITLENPISIKDLEQMVSNMVDEVEERMGVLLEMYTERYGFDSLSSGTFESMEHEATSPSHGDNDFLNDFYNGNDTSLIETETELQRYLKEPKVKLRKGRIFDILQWWKVNGPRFPIVARMARDILAIQISTVASESALITGGRVLDPYRTSLSTKIVEALICTQDWVRKSRKPINVDSLEDPLNDNEIVKDMEYELEKGEQNLG